MSLFTWLLLLVAAAPSIQAPEPSNQKAAVEWLDKAEKALIEAPAIQLKAERKVTMCVAPEIWIRKVQATVLLTRGGRMRIDSTESLLAEKTDAAPVRTQVRCDGSNFGVAEGPDPDRPKEKKVRGAPVGLSANVAAVLIRTGLEVAYIGWPIANFEGDRLPDTAFAVDKARVVEETKVGERPAVHLEYEVSCFGKGYRHELWLDRETLAPLKRKCLETDLFDHARILGYEETYEPVRRHVKLPDEDVAMPKSWTSK